MLKANPYRNILVSIAILITALLFSACGDSSEVKSTQVLVAMENLIPTPSSCNKIYDPSFPELEKSIKISNQIFLGKVTKFDPYIWNTPTGKAPTYVCIDEYAPFIPVHIQVLETLKGNLITNSEVILLIRHENIAKAPLYLPAINIETGEEIVWFLGGLKNYRESNPANPLNYPEIYARYYKVWNGWDGYLARGDFANIDELKSLITKVSLTPTPPATKK